MQDKGGRTQWSAYASSGAGASGSGSGSGGSRNATPSASGSTTKPSNSSPNAYTGTKYQAGYVPARTPSPSPVTPQAQQHFPVHAQQQLQQPQSSITPTPSAAATISPAPAMTPATSTGIVTRVRALHTFEPTEPGELAFEKGEIIKVVDRGYKDWWRGQLKGRTGIFPVNYVVCFSSSFVLLFLH